MILASILYVVSELLSIVEHTLSNTERTTTFQHAQYHPRALNIDLSTNQSHCVQVYESTPDTPWSN